MNEIDYKRLTDEQLEDMFPSFLFPRKPLRHQLISFAFAMDQGRSRVYFCHDIGTGKTLTALYTAKLWGAKKILVVCPNSTVKKTWEPQTSKYTDFSYSVLDGSTADRVKKLDKHRNLYIINYEGLIRIYCEKVEKTADKEGSFKIDKKSFIDDFDCVIFDEIHKLKSHTSLRSKIAVQLSKRAKFIIGMTGTPISTSELNLWSEYFIVDRGVSLGTNFYAFRSTYFNEVPIQLKSGRGIAIWPIRKGARDQILNRVANCTIRFDRQECLDLPELQYQTYLAAPTKEQQNILDDLASGFRVDLAQGSLSIQNPLVRSMRMQQVTGGFLPNDQGDLNPIDTPKLDLLDERLDEIEGKVIVFHTFIEEGHRIEELLRKRKTKFRSLRGEIKDKEEQYTDFREDPTIKVLVAHPACGGEGIDLYEASTIIFYSSPADPIVRKQAEGRIYRQGQTKKCLVIDLVLEGTIDEIVAERAETLKDVLNKILEFMKNYKHEVKI